MKIRTIISVCSLVTATLLTFESYGQNPIDLKKREQARSDSIRKIDQNLQQQDESKNKYRMDNAKDASEETKAEAKQEKRVERDASNASYQSKKALKKEKKAQRSRKQADKQSKKASEARDKSNSN
jgi:hypothetical protein